MIDDTVKEISETISKVMGDEKPPEAYTQLSYYIYTLAEKMRYRTFWDVYEYLDEFQSLAKVSHIPGIRAALDQISGLIAEIDGDDVDLDEGDSGITVMDFEKDLLEDLQVGDEIPYDPAESPCGEILDLGEQLGVIECSREEHPSSAWHHVIRGTRLVGRWRGDSGELSGDIYE